MKRVKAIYIFTLFAAVFLMVAVSACKDDTILSSEPDLEQPAPGGEGDLFYMALRVYNAADIQASTRAGETNLPGDYTHSEGHKFNIGLAEENAIFPGTAENTPNYILVFSQDNPTDPILEKLMPLFDFDSESIVDTSDTTKYSGYKSYRTFYTAASKLEIPENIQSRKVLLVVNASSSLQTWLKTAEGKTYSEVTGYTLGSMAETDSNFLYFNYQPSDEDPENQETTTTPTKYFTMSSSMVIYNKSDGTTSPPYYGPAVTVWPFEWYPTKQKAAEKPVFSFFVERLHSKYTLYFKKKDNKFYYFSNETSASTGYQPVTHLVLTRGEDFNVETGKESLRFVKEYHRGTSITDRGTVEIYSTPKWKINITGWNVNGIEKQEYLFKKLDPTANSSSYYNGWNPSSLSQYRNFWAEGVNYEVGSYPVQYRSAADHSKIEGLEPLPELKALSNGASSYSLNYFNYLDLSQRDPHQYAGENTIDPSTNLKDNEPLKTKEYIRHNTHIIVTAQLLIGGSGEGESYDGFDNEQAYAANHFDDNGQVVTPVYDGDDEPVASKLLMNDIFWSEQAYKAYVLEYLGYFMLSAENKTDDRFGKNNDGVIYVSTQAGLATLDDEGLTSLEESTYGPATGSYFTLGHIKMLNGDNMVYVTPRSQTFYMYTKDATTGKLKSISRELFEKLVLAHPEYFAEHFNKGLMYYVIPVNHDTAQHDGMGVGRFGSVRNHWYNFTVTNINTVGNAVDVESQPIVPNNLPVYDALGVELQVLPWHEISTDVDIQGQRPNVNPDNIDVDLYIKANDWIYSPNESNQ